MIAFQVDDMSCGHCIAAVTRAVKAIDEDATVTVDLARHRVEIDAGRSDAGTLAAAIRAAGYTPVAA